MGRYPVHRHRLPKKRHCVLEASASLISRRTMPLNTEVAAFVTDFKAETRERTGQSLCDVVHAGLRLVPQQSVHGHHHSWSAEATLGAVSLRYPLLQSNRHSIHNSDSWNSFDIKRLFLAWCLSPPAVQTVLLRWVTSDTHLYRVDPGLGAADTLHRGHGGSVELADRQEAGIDCVMSDGVVKVKDKS